MKNKINLLAPVNSLGYGVVGHNVLMELVRRGFFVSWWPIGPVEIAVPRAQKTYQLSINRQDEYDGRAPSLKIWHQFQLAEHVGKGLHCAYPVFELNKFRSVEKNHLSQQDVIFATSCWHKEVLLNEPSISGTIHLAPLGVDTSIFYPREDIQPDPSWTTFLNCGKWEIRKGHDVLLEAFNKAFEPKDRVRLWMLTYNPFLQPDQNNGVDGNEEWENMYRTSKMGGKITFLKRFKYHENIAHLMNEVDCGVFPSRAEGWNLEALEMMAVGKPVILTYYSGHTEFANRLNSMVLDIKETEEAYDGKWFYGAEAGFGEWAKLDQNVVDQLVNYLRTVHQRKQQGTLTTNGINSFALKTARKFSWKNTVDNLLKGMEVEQSV